jgi:hypothetical protein
LVDLHEATEDEAVFVRAERADAVRQRGWQHGDGSVGEVDAGGAETGFKVERGARMDVVGDVGDVDLQLGVAVGERADQDSVIEVAGGLAVDGDDGERTEVFS